MANTRLQRHRNKQLTFSIIFFATILVIVVIFIATIGFKILLNSSIFVADITRPKNENSAKNNNLLTSNITIDDIPTATNSAQFIIRGTAPDFKQLTFYIDDDSVKEISPIKDNFEEQIGDLEEGQNEVYVKGTQKDNNKERQTATYNVFYKKDKPKIEITAPGDKSTIDIQEVTVSGQTDKDVFVKVNQLPVVITSEGIFQTTVKLNEGENKIIIEAQDVAGNIEQKELTVTYSKD